MPEKTKNHSNFQNVASSHYISLCRLSPMTPALRASTQIYKAIFESS